MIRKIAGTLLVLHGLAHALPGMRVTDPTLWGSSGSGILLRLATLLWALAAAGILAAGLGLLGAAPFRERVPPGRVDRRGGFRGAAPSAVAHALGDSGAGHRRGRGDGAVQDAVHAGVAALPRR